MAIPINRGSSALCASLVEIGLPSGVGREALENKETSKTQSPLETSLEDGRVDARAVKVRPIDLKVPMRVLRQTILIGRAAPGEIDMVNLRDEASECSRSHVDLLTVIRASRSVDVKAGENLADGLVDTQDNLIIEINKPDSGFCLR